MEKRGVVWGSLIPWLIAIGVLVLTVVLITILNSKGLESWEYFKDLWRFGR